MAIPKARIQIRIMRLMAEETDAFAHDEPIDEATRSTFTAVGMTRELARTQARIMWALAHEPDLEVFSESQ